MPRSWAMLIHLPLFRWMCIATTTKFWFSSFGGQCVTMSCPSSRWKALFLTCTNYPRTNHVFFWCVLKRGTGLLICKEQYILFHVLSITADDDLTSKYGRAIVKRCMRSKLDSSFFAGPCTGGSAWNRLNRWFSDHTARLIEAKRKIFWDLWEEFVDELCDSINRGSPALMELPRGCEYWKDERATLAIEGIYIYIYMVYTYIRMYTDLLHI